MKKGFFSRRVVLTKEGVPKVCPVDGFVLRLLFSLHNTACPFLVLRQQCYKYYPNTVHLPLASQLLHLLLILLQWHLLLVFCLLLL